MQINICIGAGIWYTQQTIRSYIYWWSHPSNLSTFFIQAKKNTNALCQKFSLNSKDEKWKVC